MKDRRLIVLVGLAFVTAAAPALRGAAADPVALINHAREVVRAVNPPEHGLTKALADVLEASLVIMPQTDYSKEYRSRIEGAKKMFDDGHLPSDKAYQDLGLAYKLVSGGRTWRLPEEFKAAGTEKKGIEQATQICLKLLDAALAEHKAGQDTEAVRDLVGFVLLVVTPIER